MQETIAAFVSAPLRSNRRAERKKSPHMAGTDPTNGQSNFVVYTNIAM